MKNLITSAFIFVLLTSTSVQSALARPIKVPPPPPTPDFFDPYQLWAIITAIFSAHN